MVNKFKKCIQLSLIIVIYRNVSFNIIESGIQSEKIRSNNLNKVYSLATKIKRFLEFNKIKLSISIDRKSRQNQEDLIICETIFNNNSQKLGYDSQTKTLVIPLNIKNILSLFILLILTVLGSYYIWSMLTRKKCLCKICRNEYTLVEKLSSGGFGEVEPKFNY